MRQTLNIPIKTSHRVSLILHLWLEADGVLRASLENTSSGERSYFNCLEDLSVQLAKTVRQLKASPLRKGIR